MKVGNLRDFRPHLYSPDRDKPRGTLEKEGHAVSTISPNHADPTHPAHHIWVGGTEQWIRGHAVKPPPAIIAH